MELTAIFFVILSLTLSPLSCYQSSDRELSRETLSYLISYESLSQLDTLDEKHKPKPYNISTPCRAFLTELSKHGSEFIRCSIDKSRPFRLCMSCGQSYTKTMRTFDDIQEDDTTDKSCMSLLLESDRVQVLDQISKNIREIWTDSVCDGCYNSITEFNNGTVDYSFSEDTLTFIDLFENTTRCIHAYMNISLYGDDYGAGTINKSVCSDCRAEYRALNQHFVSMQEKANYQICMDLVDMMNYTRLMWGHELSCTKNYKDDKLILLIGLIMATLPVMFYSVGRVCGGRKKIKLMQQKRMSKKVLQHHYGSFSLSLTEEDGNQDGLDNHVHISDTTPVLFRGNRIILPTE